MTREATIKSLLVWRKLDSQLLYEKAPRIYNKKTKTLCNDLDCITGLLGPCKVRLVKGEFAKIILHGYGDIV